MVTWRKYGGAYMVRPYMYGYTIYGNKPFLFFSFLLLSK